jgi:predicted AAA+ superfamily ATPase
MDNSQFEIIASLLNRIGVALEETNGHKNAYIPDWGDATAWLWQSHGLSLRAVEKTDSLPLDLLHGIDSQAQTLLENTTQFAKGFAANNALLWGARGTGKSSLVKSIHNKLDDDPTLPLHMIEIYREDLSTLPYLLSVLRHEPDIRFLLYIDDLSFDENDSSYKSLKAVLDGGIEGRPDNVIIYATSNRRHLLPRKMMENESSTAIHKSESVEEKVSLSDRFGLWLGFYNIDQETYLRIIHGYATHYELSVNDKEALEWAMTRGNRSGRVAYQFIQNIAGQQGKKLT